MAHPKKVVWEESANLGHPNPDDFPLATKGEFCSKYNEIYSSPTITFDKVCLQLSVKDSVVSNIMVG